MAANTITMLQIRRIIQLHGNGESKRSIARQCSLSRNTVKEYLVLINKSGLNVGELLSMDDLQLNRLLHDPSRSTALPDNRQPALESQFDTLSKELRKTGVTRQLLWQEYRIMYPDGYSYSQFCHLLNQHLQTKETVMHFFHKAGEKMLVDFAGKTMHYTTHTGEKVSCQIFIAVLPFSGYTYTEAVHSQQQGDFLNCMENALRYFGGVPGCIVSDNLKSCIKKANRYEPELTELLEQFSLHYNTTVTAARIYKPRDKASVEKAVHLAYERVYAPLRNQTFSSLTDLNTAITHQLHAHHQRNFRNTEQTREQLFKQQEQELLRSLPSSRMGISQTASAKVQRNYHIVLGQDWHYYSVPYQYTGKQVKIIYTDTTVEIYYELKRIALHTRSRKRNGYSTHTDHMPSNHQHHSQIKGWDADYFRNKAKGLSPEIGQAIECILQSRFFYEQTYNACLGILRLADKYSCDRLSQACKIALQAKAVNYRFINNILINNMDQKEQASETTNVVSMGWHKNLRGPLAYQ